MGSIQHAVILHHTSSPQPILEAPMEYVPHGEDFGRAYEPRPREIEMPSRNSIMAAWRASNAERQALIDQGINIPLHPLPMGACQAILADHEAMRRRDATDALMLMVEQHGLKTVKAWLRNIEHMEGGE